MPNTKCKWNFGCVQHEAVTGFRCRAVRYVLFTNIMQSSSTGDRDGIYWLKYLPHKIYSGIRHLLPIHQHNGLCTLQSMVAAQSQLSTTLRLHLVSIYIYESFPFKWNVRDCTIVHWKEHHWHARKWSQTQKRIRFLAAAAAAANRKIGEKKRENLSWFLSDAGLEVMNEILSAIITSHNIPKS